MEDKNKQLWDSILAELELVLTKPVFSTWFKDTFIVDNNDGRVTVGVPTTFAQAWMQQKYHHKIYQILQTKLTGIRVKEIKYSVQNIKDFYKQAIELKQTIKQEAAAVVSSPFDSITFKQTGLNPRYTFETFVTGKNNELATAAAKAVADNPGHAYNPLFLYGGVGLGKTHLMQAIGSKILSKFPNKKIKYTTCEQFTNHFINSIQGGKMAEFTKTYRTPDVLMVDDIQFLSGKEGTQDAFFHTFNELYQNDRQLVITSDRPPKALAILEDRLLTRFEWGMIADISQPDMETRIAILETKCKEKNFNLDRQIIHYITLNIQNNIRELEGALNKVIAYHQLNKQPISLDSVKSILFSLSVSGKQTGSLTPRKIIESICEFYELRVEEITGPSREKRLAYPRQIIMYILRDELQSSYPTIGQELGNRDHTTAIHAFNKIQRELDVNEKLRQEVNLLKQRIYNV